jgi:peptidoglycan-associated lipoprotein
MEDNPNLTIELRAHTDFRGNDDYNMELSLERAKSCVVYLIEKGVKADRLTAKGLGETEPKVIDKELNKAFPYFPVGTVLDEEYITNLKDNKKREEAHQINRRTEFSVLSTDYGVSEEEKKIEEEKIEKSQNSAIIKETKGGDF